MKGKAYAREASWLLKEKYHGRLTESAKADLARLGRGEPVDYLIGFVEFAGCVIDLSFKPLIPRPETEYWVMEAMRELKKDRRRELYCLDMFSGSGCIGMAVLKHVPFSRVDFAEKEEKLISQIRLNLKKNGLSGKRSRPFRTDIFSNIPGKYDCIFANPPYVAESRKRTVQASVLKHEPKAALFAGKDGLRYIKRFLKEAKEHLYPGGKIYMEFDSPQQREIDRLLEKYGYGTRVFRKDQYGRWRWCAAAI
ncbi:MAG: HemK family protein methyltransferase [bacterium]|nr:HemK family protein methyltransferase [bacterium]